MMKPPHFVGLLKQTYAEWSEDKGPRLGAALAYYALNKAAVQIYKGGNYGTS